MTVVSGSKKIHGYSKSYGDVYYIKKPWFKFGSIFLSNYPFKIHQFLKTNPFDVLNAHTMDFASINKKYRRKLIFTPHGFNWIEQKFVNPLKKPLWYFNYVRRFFSIMKNIEYLVSINPYSTIKFKEFSNAKIFEIYNPVENEFFNIDQKPLQNTFLWMGVISKMKNLLILLRALVLIKEKKKDFTLFVAGKIEDIEYYRQLTIFIERNKLTDNVVFLGVINNKDKLEYLSKMSFIVLTSLNEHAPMVISESFASSRPVIASKVGGIPYMVDDEETGFLIDPLNEKEIADKILYLIENPQVAEMMGKKARQTACKQNRLPIVINQYIEAYNYVYDHL